MKHRFANRSMRSAILSAAKNPAAGRPFASLRVTGVESPCACAKGVLCSFLGPSRRASRRGAVLIAALVCVAVAAVVFMSALKMASAQRHRMETELWQLQAAWLAESGLERAAERLAARPDFTGETWNIAPEQLGGSYAAVVRIRVEPVRDQPKSWLVRVEADYPDHPKDRARESRETILRVP